jgi:hypothetical protein
MKSLRAFQFGEFLQPLARFDGDNAPTIALAANI